jgi:hypothetical protein
MRRGQDSSDVTEESRGLIGDRKCNRTVSIGLLSLFVEYLDWNARREGIHIGLRIASPIESNHGMVAAPWIRPGNPR